MTNIDFTRIANVIYPARFAVNVKEFIEIEEWKARIIVVLPSPTSEKIVKIVEAQPFEKRVAFYGTICDAALAGYDFSAVDTIEDISDVYARYLIKKVFG